MTIRKAVSRPTTTGASVHGARAYVFDDWKRLPGAEVEVSQGSQFIRRGTVDAATEDSEIIWLAPNGVSERVMIDKTEGYKLWISPAQLQHVTAHPSAPSVSENCTKLRDQTPLFQSLSLHSPSRPRRGGP